MTGWRAAWLAMLHRLPSGPSWRRVALWLRKPLKHALAEIADVEVWDLKLRLHTRDNLSEQRLLLMPQFLDGVERALLARELNSGDVFLDIGANAGVYSLWVAANCGNVRIEAFEPDPEMCRRLRFNIHTNALNQITLHECALGKTSGEATLVPGSRNRGENVVTPDAASGTRVRMEPLPELLQRRGIPFIKALKIDVEGSELEVLAPLFEARDATTYPEILICELTPEVERAPLKKLLEKHGYELEVLGRLNGVYRRQP